jgi:glycosyl transferase family 25
MVMSKVPPKVYVLNLDRSPERLKDFIQSFSPTGLEVVRVSGVDGNELTLPHPDYDERKYRLYHGKQTSMGAIGCYFSHIKALRQFLESNEETALICEDDVAAKQELSQVLDEVLAFQNHWDLLRLNCLHIPTHVPVRKLESGYRLSVPVYWAGGTGAYLVNRNAAEKIIACSLPMYLPYDHAFEQNWRMNLTAMMVVPFPIVLNEHCGCSTITARTIPRDKLSFVQRYLCSPLLPYRGLMTCQRWRKQLSTALWYRLFPPLETMEERQ